MLTRDAPPGCWLARVQIAYQLWVKQHRAEFSEAELSERRTMCENPLPPEGRAPSSHAPCRPFQV